jgi:Transcriptional regulator PadR-like family
MNETLSRDLFPGALEMMILESLRRQPAHGYALVQHIQQRSNNLLQVEEGHFTRRYSDCSSRNWSSPVEAQRQARMAFGNLAMLEERSREIWLWPTLESMWADIRLAGAATEKVSGVCSHSRPDPRHGDRRERSHVGRTEWPDSSAS